MDEKAQPRHRHRRARSNFLPVLIRSLLSWALPRWGKTKSVCPCSQGQTLEKHLRCHLDCCFYKNSPLRKCKHIPCPVTRARVLDTKAATLVPLALRGPFANSLSAGLSALPTLCECAFGVISASTVSSIKAQPARVVKGEKKNFQCGTGAKGRMIPLSQ